MQNTSSVYNEEDQIRNVNKFRKIFGYVSIITGIVLTVVTLPSGISIIPLIIAGYFFVNGSMCFMKI